MVSAREIQAVAELLQVSPEGLQKAITFKVTVSLRALHPDKGLFLWGHSSLPSPPHPLLSVKSGEGASLQASTWAFPSLDYLILPLLPVWLELGVDTSTHDMLTSKKPSLMLAGSELLPSSSQTGVFLCWSSLLYQQPPLLLE